MVRTKRNLEIFHEYNKEKKTPWKERYDLIVSQFPSVTSIDWAKSFSQDIDLFGRIHRDIMRIDQVNQKTGPGPRPVLDEKTGWNRLQQIRGEDFSDFPFRETFRSLSGTRSLRHIATKVGISYVMVHRLLNGDREPDLWLLEQIAIAFKKHPSFFVEYRIAYILGAFGDQLDRSPETSIDLYKLLSRAARNERVG